MSTRLDTQRPVCALARFAPPAHGRSAMWTLPNILTLARIVAVIPVVALIEARQWLAALALFAAAALTDFLDGWIARRWHLQSEFGRFLDPLADKIMVAGALIAIVDTHAIEDAAVVPVIAIVAREIAVAGLREYLGPKGIVVHVTRLAKWKTATQLVAVGASIAAPLAVSLAPPLSTQVFVTATLAVGLLWLAALLAWISAWGYFRSGLAHMSAS